MNKCPACSHPRAYIGLNSVECVDMQCRYYSKDLAMSYCLEDSDSDDVNRVMVADSASACGYSWIHVKDLGTDKDPSKRGARAVLLPANHDPFDDASWDDDTLDLA